MQIVTYAPSGFALPRQHRAWIAFYTLADRTNLKPREVVLRENDLIEDDLLGYAESWERMRARIKQAASRMYLAATA